MGQIKLTLRGLGMLVDRGDYWEILFPAAEKRLRRYFGFDSESLPHHDPILRIDGANTSNGRDRAIDLRGRVLDLTDATAKGEVHEIKQNWMIGLKLPTEAPARDLSAIATSDRVVGGVRLNKGSLAPLKPVNNVWFGGRLYPILATQVEWTGTTEIGTPSVHVRLRNGRLASEGTIELHGEAIHLEIANLSVADAQDEHNIKTPRYVDEDFAALYMFAAQMHSMHFDVPRIQVPPAPTQVELAGGPWVDPEHLCSTVYGEDDPPTVASIAADNPTAVQIVAPSSATTASPAPADARN